MQMRGLLSIAAVLMSLMSGAVAAQEPVIGGDDQAAPAAAPAAPPAAAWASRCVADSRAGALECSLLQRAVTQQGQLVASVTIQLPAGAAPRMIVSVPLGLYLGAGVGYDVDGAGAAKLDLQTCDRTACYAEAQITPEVITAMQNGQKLNITFQTMAKKAAGVPMSLTGFTAAYNKAK